MGADGGVAYARPTPQASARDTRRRRSVESAMPSTPPWETDAARALIARVAPDTHDPRGAWLAAVREALTGRTVAAAAAHLGVGARTIGRWLASLAADYPALRADLPVGPEGRPATGGPGSRGGTSRVTRWRASRFVTGVAEDDTDESREKTRL